MGYLKTTGYREFHAFASSNCMVHYTFLPPFSCILILSKSLACFSALIQIFTLLSSLSLSSLRLLFYSSHTRPIVFPRSVFLSRVHIQLYPLVDPNGNLRAILCLPGSFDCSFEDVASFNLDSAYRARACRRLKSSNKPTEKGRSKFRQFAYIFRKEY